MNAYPTRNRFLTSTALSLAIVATAPAVAETAQPDPQATQQPAQSPSTVFAIEEVTVTARKVQENLQTVPVAITALSANALEQNAIKDIGNLQGQAPNVEIGRHGSFPSSAQITIRGMTSMDIERSFEPSVGVVVDGFFLNSNANQMVDMFDIGGVEILRGPQGTLFGKNTIGGVVNVKRQQPTDELELKAQATVGNYGRLDTKGVVNVPLMKEKLAVRLGVASIKSDGYVRNLTTGNDLNGDDILTFRGAIKATPNENFDITINYDYFRNRNDGTGQVNISRPGQVLCLFGFCGVEKPNGDWTDADNDLYTVTQNTDGQNHEDIHTIIGEMNYDIGDIVLTSITGYRHIKERIVTDFDGSPIPFLEADRAQTSKQFTEELRAAGKLGDSIDFVAGVYYFYASYDLFQISNLSALGAGFIDQSTQHKDESWAGFLQGNWNITDQLRLNLGGRYTWEKKTITHRPLGFPAAIGPLDETWKRFTPRVGLDYKIDDASMVYASFATGFKSGGWNGRAGSYTSVGPYDPEKITAYEIGYKSEFMDRRVRMNIAGFYNDYKDLQLDINRPIGVGGQETTVTNAANAETYGLELELTVIPVEGLTLSGNAGYLRAKYKDFSADLDGSGVITDNSGLKFRRAPKWQFAAGANYSYGLPGDIGDLAFNVLYSWRSSAELTVQNFDIGHQRSVGGLNGTVSYTTPSERIRVALYGRNLTNEHYIEYVLPVANLFDFASPSIPREYGIELTLKY